MDQSSTDTAAIQTLAQRILNEINTGPVREDLAARITARLEEAVYEWLYRERERCVAICKCRAAL